ncbi:MAG: hypothetical protein GPOALKHO_001622 [Sodalis sp.]|nr:MAG: hypothetical protein GPOALKHO_001622 [Sodalis sp.]
MIDPALGVALKREMFPRQGADIHAIALSVLSPIGGHKLACIKVRSQ